MTTNREAGTAPVGSQPVSREPVAWRDPDNTNPAQSVTFRREVAQRWPHIFTQPLYPPLAHEGISEDALDAKRYRWLRENSYVEVRCDSPRHPDWRPDALDAAIDAAMAKESK